MIRISSSKPRADARMLAAAAAACAAAAGLAACSVPSGAPAATVTHTATAPASQASASQAPAAGNSPAADTSAGGKIPDYRPSTVVSRSASSTVLTSPDSVGKIGAFYRDALAQGGWQVTSSSTSAYHASFTVHRSGEGASISVYPRGSGSGISISTYPR